MSLLALLLAGGCDSPPPGPPLRYPDLTAAILARVDGDANGRLDATEYGRAAMDDEPLATYDLDGDGALSAYEVEACFLETSPSRLAASRLEALRTQMREGRGPGPRQGPPQPGSQPTTPAQPR